MFRPRVNASLVFIFNPQDHIRENTPGFYSEKTFSIHDPEVGLQWLTNITTTKVKLLRKIHCPVHAVYNPGPHPNFLTNEPAIGPIWRKFIRTLSTEASGLEEAVFILDSEPECNHWGPAVDNDFVRALGCLSGLRKLEIKGYFPKEWPQYLKEKTGLSVWEEEGQQESDLRNLRSFQRLYFRDQRIDD